MVTRVTAFSTVSAPEHAAEIPAVPIGEETAAMAGVLCLRPDVVAEGNANFQLDFGGNQDIIFSP